MAQRPASQRRWRRPPPQWPRPRQQSLPRHRGPLPPMFLSRDSIASGRHPVREVLHHADAGTKEPTNPGALRRGRNPNHIHRAVRPSPREGPRSPSPRGPPTWRRPRTREVIKSSSHPRVFTRARTSSALPVHGYTQAWLLHGALSLAGVAPASPPEWHMISGFGPVRRIMLPSATPWSNMRDMVWW